MIRAILAMRCLIQFVGQAVGLMLLHRRWKAEHWPFRMWLYPVPVLLAIVGWLAIFISTGRRPMLASLAAMAAGILVYMGRARMLRQWPFEEAGTLNWMTRRMLFSIGGDRLQRIFICSVRGGRFGAQALPETVEAIHKARVSTRILFITAHPDDEGPACWRIFRMD